MMNQGNSISNAASTLLTASRVAGKPLVIPMFPVGNEIGLKPGDLKPGRSEIPPSCDGLVVAISCSADDVQELVDLIRFWQAKKVTQGGRNG